MEKKSGHQREGGKVKSGKLNNLCKTNRSKEERSEGDQGGTNWGNKTRVGGNRVGRGFGRKGYQTKERSKVGEGVNVQVWGKQHQALGGFKWWRGIQLREFSGKNVKIALVCGKVRKGEPMGGKWKFI